MKSNIITMLKQTQNKVMLALESQSSYRQQWSRVILYLTARTNSVAISSTLNDFTSTELELNNAENVKSTKLLGQSSKFLVVNKKWYTEIEGHIKTICKAW